MEKGVIFNIQKFCINDGPGIRTTVFYKGCPLNCLWCHNPESKSVKPEIFFDSSKCLLCGKCMPVCPNGCHIFEENTHNFNRKNCVACGSCTDECLAEALESVGYESTVDEIIADVLKDKVFYDNSGGGMTVSGGEPMMQFEFTYSLLKRAKEEELHICMETCGYAATEKYLKIAELVDIFLFDFKATDPEKHKEFTGFDNKLILKNLKVLDEAGAKIILRCPIIPSLNDTPEHFKGIADTANSLKNILEINIEPYHPLGSGKSSKLGKEYPLENLTFPTDESVKEWISIIQNQTKVEVKKA